MNWESEKIKTIVKYLNRVSKSEEIGLMDQDFFLTRDELNKLINNYYLGFDNQRELNEELIFRHKSIVDLEFEEGGFSRIKDLSNNSKVNYSQQEHQAYAFMVWKILINEFEKKLNLKVKDKPHLGIKNKEVHELFKLIDAELGIFSSGENFIEASVYQRKEDFYLNITNREFHYILTLLKPYFNNFEYSKFVISNNIFSKNGTQLTKENLHNSKSYTTNNAALIDEIINNFKK